MDDGPIGISEKALDRLLLTILAVTGAAFVWHVAAWAYVLISGDWPA